ncbi:MAG: 4-phosphoerythronate dehydrogenase [Pseudohongiella sp.]|nr:4-phosphoerythronate dehydrogenase [Pseudohongiella sp.]MDP2126228.1 4-phosphoerythronate dehydrogenase [Pseudohongiella sp.]
MKIVADENILTLSGKKSKNINWVLKSGREITSVDVADADALLVRSVTKVDAALLGDSSVRFVATATSGTDHLDLDWLAARGIGVADAAGANANAVAEYVLAALAELILEDDLALWDKTVAVIGVGNVGTAMIRKLKALGVTCVACDPLHQRVSKIDYVSLEQALQADIICLHTPLTHEGPHATFNLINDERLHTMNPDAVLVNAGRGEVIDNNALLAHLQRFPDRRVVLDVWANEPRPSAQLLDRVFIGTPHIAGYSVEAKLAASQCVFNALSSHFSLDRLQLNVGAGGPLRVHDQRYEQKSESLLYCEKTDARMFASIVTRSFGLRALYRRFNDIYQVASRSDNPMDGAEVFDSIRRELTERREFGATHVHAAGFSPRLSAWLHAAGFVLQA